MGCWTMGAGACAGLTASRRETGGATWTGVGAGVAVGVAVGVEMGREGTAVPGIVRGRAGGGTPGAAGVTVRVWGWAVGTVTVWIGAGRGAVTGVGRVAGADGVPDDDGGVGVVGFRREPPLLVVGMPTEAEGAGRGTGARRDSASRTGPVSVDGPAAGVIGTEAAGRLPPGRFGAGRVRVIRSMGAAEGIGEGREGLVEGTRPAAGTFAGRLGFSDPPPEGIARGRATSGWMPMRSEGVPFPRVGIGRDTSWRWRTDAGGRESCTGTVGRYTATSAGRPPEGLGRDRAKACAAAGLFTSRSSVRRISSRVWRCTSSRLMPLLMITVLLSPRMFTFWLPAMWTLLSWTNCSTRCRGRR